MTLALALILACAAPAPKDRPPPPPPAIKHGSYTMTWHGTEAETHFHADGFYACLWHGRWWHGQWKMDGGVLCVSEWPMDTPQFTTSWGVVMKCDRAGNMRARNMTGSPWKVVPLAGNVY